MKIQRAVRYCILILIAAVLLVSAIFILINRESILYYDLIKEFPDAEITTDIEPSYIDKLSVIYQPEKIDRDARRLISLLFSNFKEIRLSTDQSAGEVDMNHGGVSLEAFPEGKVNNEKYVLKLSSNNPKDYIALRIGKNKNRVYTWLYRNRADKIEDLYRAGFVIRKKESLRIYLILINKTVTLCIDNKWHYHFSDKNLPQKCSLKIINDGNRPYNFKDILKLPGGASILKEELSDLLSSGDLGRWLGVSERRWNNLRPEHLIEIDGKTYPYLQRVRTEDITHPAILLPAGSSIKYNIDIPENAVLSFSANVLPPAVGKSNTGTFGIQIDCGNGLNNRYSFNYNFGSTLYTPWENYDLDLGKYADKRCSLTLSGKSGDDKADEKPVMVWGAPGIHCKRKKEDKNVLIILLDTLRSDHLGCYGYNRVTSANIDRFAAENILFRYAVSSAPWTLPSHISIFSGLYPTEAGAVQEMKGERTLRKSRLAPGINSLASYFKDNGYKTCAITGSGFVASFYGFDRGFDSYLENTPNWSERDIAKEVPPVIDWIRKNKDYKFFFFFHTFEIHRPYLRRHFVPVSPDDTVAGVIANYDSGIWYADKQIGELLDFLKKEKILENTLVIITSDHGENFDFVDPQKRIFWGSHGTTMKDSELLVPLIIGGPADFKKSSVIKDQVRLVDLLPTLLDYFKIELKEEVRGQSILPLIEGKSEAERISYSESILLLNKPYFEENALRTLKYKLIEKIPFGHKYRGFVNDLYSFYNLSKDPRESLNLYMSESKLSSYYKNLLERIRKSINTNRQKIRKQLSMIDSTPLEHTKILRHLGYLGN